MITLMVLVTSAIALASEQPTQPQQFAGSVVINGKPAQDGLTVQAYIDGQGRESTLTSNGKYGYDEVYFVTAPTAGAGSGDTSTITFYVEGYNTGVTATLNPDAGPQMVDIEFFGSFGCGDNSCSSSESCSSCPQDCGSCPVTTTTQPSSGGGGSGGGSSGGGGGYYHTTTTSTTTSTSTSTTTTTTIEATNYESPSVEMNNTNETNCTPDWTCTEWTECSEGTQTRTCTDNNQCDVEDGKPSETQSCIVEKVASSEEKSSNEEKGNELTGQVVKTNQENSSYPKWIYGGLGVIILGGLFIFALWKRKNS